MARLVRQLLDFTRARMAGRHSAAPPGGALEEVRRASSPSWSPPTPIGAFAGGARGLSAALGRGAAGAGVLQPGGQRAPAQPGGLAGEGAAGGHERSSRGGGCTTRGPPSDALRPALFEPFHRSESSASKPPRAGGLGLGLSARRPDDVRRTVQVGASPSGEGARSSSCCCPRSVPRRRVGETPRLRSPLSPAGGSSSPAQTRRRWPVDGPPAEQHHARRMRSALCHLRQLLLEDGVMRSGGLSSTDRSSFSSRQAVARTVAVASLLRNREIFLRETSPPPCPGRASPSHPRARGRRRSGRAAQGEERRCLRLA